MSDINKIVAAILTSGRMPTMTQTSGVRESGDWLAEYNMWVEALNKQDAAEGKAKASQWTKGMMSALEDEAKR